MKEGTNLTRQLNSKLQSRWGNLLLLILLFIAIIGPRLLVLRQTVTVDEHKWMVRSANFSYGLIQGDYKATFQRGHPGVTVMWAGTLAQSILLPNYVEIGQQNIDQWAYVGLLRDQGIAELDMLAAERAVVVFVFSLTLLGAFVYARPLLGTAVSVTAILFIAFSPFIAAHSHLLQLDGMSASFTLLSLTAFLHYWYKPRPFTLIISGIAAGLSWLTRSPTLLLIPIFGLIVLLQIWRQRQSGTQSWPKSLLHHGLIFSLWGICGLVTTIILWPSMWVVPLQTVSEVLNLASVRAANGHRTAVYFDNEIIEDGNLGLALFYFYPTTFLWRATPVILVGLVAGLVAFVRRHQPFTSQTHRDTVVAFLIFTFAFSTMMTLGGKKFDRYLLPAYGTLAFLAAGGWVAMAHWLAGKFSHPLIQKYGATAVISTAILLQAYSLISVYPYYLSYYSPLLGGGRKAPQTMLIGWGEGLDAAARYMNQKEDAENLLVASWYPPSFSFFFDGRVMDLPAVVSPEYEEQLSQADYAVVYIHQWQRNLPANLLARFQKQTPEHTIWINGIEYVKIYNLQPVPGE